MYALAQRIVGASIIGVLFCTCDLKAEGFFIDPQSAEGMGYAQAGAPIGYRDGSASFYNPAALTLHSRPQVSGQLHGFSAKATFKDDGSSVAGIPNRGSQGSDGGKDALLPTGYAVLPITQDIIAGTYINSPYGLGTEYRKDWIGRYQGIESSMKMINIGSAFGYNASDYFSIGAGVSAIHAEAKLSSAIDLGSIAQQALGPQQSQIIGFEPQANDAISKISASDWGVGWNIGALYEYGDHRSHRVGVSFRGPTQLDLHGRYANFSLPPEGEILSSQGLFSNTQARSSITLPETFSVGHKFALTDSFYFLNQSTWTRWGRYRDITVAFDNPLQPSSIVSQEWKNTWFHSLGVGYALTECVELRAGVAYETAMIPDATHRYPRLPTSESVWGSMGIGISVPELNTTIDISFTRVDYRGGYADAVGPTGDRLRGDWSNKTNALSAGVTLHW